MKMWNEYGAEHSSRMRVIGKFKDARSAAIAKEYIDNLIDNLAKVVGMDDRRTHFSEDISDVLLNAKFHMLHPFEIDQFFGERIPSFDKKSDTLTLYTDEAEVTALIKLLLHKGARVEVFSENDYPPDEDEEELE